jgi:regulator of sigma D
MNKSAPDKQERRTQERRSGTQQMVDKLLKERREVIVMYCRVAGLEPYRAERPTMDLLQEFCQVLVDYSAFGHFEVYERIASGRERRQKVIDIAEQVYSRIVEASELAVQFNDKYDAGDHTLLMADLSDDLSRLGEELAVRVELEDRIIEALLAR